MNKFSFGWLTCLLLSLPLSAFSATIHTSKAGDDSNSCAEATNPSTPKLTIAASIDCLNSGDTLVVAAGVYEEFDLGNNIPDGFAQNPTIIRASVGERATIRIPDSTSPGVLNNNPNGTGGPSPIQRCFYFPGKSNIVIDGINCDGNGWRGWDGIKSDQGSRNITFRNLSVTDFWNQGIKINGVSSHEFHNCDVSRNGSGDFRHGIYIDGDNHKIWHCDIHENGGWGIQIYGGASQDFVDIRYNRIWGNGAVGPRGDGIVSYGSNGVFINNVVWGNAQAGIALNGGTNNKVFHNTVYDNGETSGWHGIHIGSSNSEVKNNIVFRDSIADLGSSNSVSNNYTGDPLFVSASASPQSADFRLQPISGAVGFGADLTAEVSDDFDGVSRSETPGIDAGAYEFTTNPPPGGDAGPIPTPPQWASN